MALLNDAGDEAAGAAAIVVVGGSEGKAERVFFDGDAIRNGQRRRNEDDGEAGPGARMRA